MLPVMDLNSQYRSEPNESVLLFFFFTHFLPVPAENPEEQHHDGLEELLGKIPDRVFVIDLSATRGSQ